MAEEEGEERRIPVAKRKKIGEVNKGDARVRITGTIIGKDKGSSSITLDDGSGEVVVLIQSDRLFKEVKTGDFVRVIGSVLAFDEGFEIKGDVIQDFSEIDKELYKKVEKILKT